MYGVSANISAAAREQVGFQRDLLTKTHLLRSHLLSFPCQGGEGVGDAGEMRSQDLEERFPLWLRVSASEVYTPQLLPLLEGSLPGWTPLQNKTPKLAKERFLAR